MKETIKELLRTNVPTLLYGKSGWGKTQMIEQSARELGMRCEVLCLAGVAPEDFGIPVTREGYYEYLPPKWAVELHETQENFVLFLDEITQATTQVLHAVYPLVLERKIGGLRLPNMRVIAASNYETENPYLTTIMTPLLNRFSVKINIEEVFGQKLIVDFWEYIENKYPNQAAIIGKLKENVITTNPRAYEAGIRFLDINPKSHDIARHLVLKGAFGELAQVIEDSITQDITVNETHDMTRLRQARLSYDAKMLLKGDKVVLDPSKDDIAKNYNLTKEEAESVFA